MARSRPKPRQNRRRRRLCLLSLGVVLASAAGAHAQISVVRTIQITDLPGIQKNPSVSGDVVVWQDDRSGVAGIYGYNLETDQEFVVATGTLAKTFPQISGSVVAWCEKSSGYGHGFGAKDLATGQSYALVSGMGGYIGSAYLAIAGRRVYYTVYDKPGMTQGIYYTDLDTGVQARISPISGDYQYEPDTDGEWVVWSDGGLMRLENIVTGETRSTRTAWGGNIFEPVLAGGKVYYKGNYNGHTSDNRIESYDILSGQFEVVSGTDFTKVAHPSADNSIAIWTNYQDMPAKFIDAADHSTGQRFRVVDLPGGGVLFNQQAFEIDDLRVAWTWTSSDYSNMNVFVTELTPEPATLALLVPGALALVRRRRKRSCTGRSRRLPDGWDRRVCRQIKEESKCPKAL